MSRITVLGGTGSAGAAIVSEAAARGHEVTSFSRSAPADPVPGVTVVTGDVSDEAAVASVIDGADVVVGALAPRGPLAGSFRDVYRMVGRLAAAAGAPFYVVGGFSSLRPAEGADRFVADPANVPAQFKDEIEAGAALVIEDLPASSDDLDWVFVSPALGFGAYTPGEKLGRYRLGGEVAVDPAGGAISAADYATGVVDLIEAGDHHREQVNLGY